MIEYIGFTISLWRAMTGKPRPVTLYDYPKFFRKLVIRRAAAQAAEQQNAVIREYRRSLQAN